MPSPAHQEAYERAKSLEPIVEFVENFARSQRHVAAADPDFDADRVWAWVIVPLINRVVGVVPGREYERASDRLDMRDFDSMDWEDVEFLHSLRAHSAVYQAILAVFDDAVAHGRKRAILKDVTRSRVVTSAAEKQGSGAKRPGRISSRPR